MSGTSHLTLPQSQTMIAKTPPMTSISNNKTAEIDEQHQQNQLQSTYASQTTQFGEATPMVGNSQQCMSSLGPDHSQEQQHNTNNNNDSFGYNFSYKIDIPRFIQTFIIHRILGDFICIDNDISDNIIDIDENRKIKNLITSVFDNSIDLDTKLDIFGALRWCIYLDLNTYIQLEAATTRTPVEMIFHQIILKKFAKEYNELISYPINTPKDYKNSKYLVFNLTDVMCHIFHYLKLKLEYDNYDKEFEFSGDLVSCSLVNSYWMYQAWNLNAIFDADLTLLVKKTINYTKKWSKKREYNMSRIWQRFSHAKSISFSINNIPNIVALSKKLAMLKSYNQLNVSFGNYETMQSVLASFESTRLKQCTIRVNQATASKLNRLNWNKNNQFNLSPLVLMNARYINVDINFYAVWGRKCNELVVKYQNINKQWCQFVFDYCDCSNIEKFSLCGTFDARSIDESVLKQLVNKLPNIKEFTILIKSSIDKNVLLFWQLLTQTILKKNNGKSKLHIEKLRENDFGVLQETIKERHLYSTLEKLSISIQPSDWNDVYFKFIQEMDHKGLKQLKIYNYGVIINQYRRRKKNIDPFHALIMVLMLRLSFESINVLEFERIEPNSSDIRNIFNYRYRYTEYLESILGSRIIIQKNLFLIVDSTIVCTQEDTMHISLIDVLSQHLVNLISKQIPIDIKITFKEIDKRSFQKCEFKFTESILASSCVSDCQYKEPKCHNNKLCVPRSRILACFRKKEEDSCAILVVSNVEYR